MDDRHLRIAVRARRWMVSGLVVSVLGNRLIDGGLDSLAASAVVPIYWLVLLTSAGKIIEFALPAYASVLKRWSPDKILIIEDLMEMVSGIVVVGLMAVWPVQQVNLLICYLGFMLFTAPVSDIADEFYGAKLAETSADHALSFNASLYSWLGIAGFIVAVPLGALVAGLSISALVTANVVLSGLGALLRLNARRKYPAKPLHDADSEDFSPLGQAQPLVQFLHDLFRSGPASPAVNFVLQTIGALTGHLVLIWAASRSALQPPEAMAMVLFVFGLAATFGPLMARSIGRRFPTELLLSATGLASVVNIGWFVIVLFCESANFASALVFVFLNVVLARLRTVVLETHRQTFFTKAQYSRVMSWSYTFGAAGTLMGLQLAYALGASQNPAWAGIVAIGLWVLISAVVRSKRGPNQKSGHAAIGADVVGAE